MSIVCLDVEEIVAQVKMTCIRHWTYDSSESLSDLLPIVGPLVCTVKIPYIFGVLHLATGCQVLHRKEYRKTYLTV